ncbi:CDP-glycerol glycerophosphotransferase family protein, partial [Rodentibacter rarus]|uniref:CDP-glycerol glycerophosphotransferase family protein n=1 Tax=Rodentibacter rarus TaxID=1908260 RepID=UPI001ABF38C9
LVQPQILYLPTWEGVYEEGNYSSARLSAAMLIEIHHRFGLHISAKFHPVTGSRDKILANAPQYVSEELQRVGASFTVADKLVPVSELLLNTNVYICDISAVVSECIAANGPIFVYIPADKEIKTAQSDMSYEDYAYTFSNIEELCNKLEQVLNGNDYLKDQRQKAMDYLLTISSTRNNEFAKKLQEIAETNYLLDNARLEVIQ